MPGFVEPEFEAKWKYVPYCSDILQLFRIGGCTMIFGPPGSGKSEMVNDIIKYTGYRHRMVILPY